MVVVPNFAKMENFATSCARIASDLNVRKVKRLLMSKECVVQNVRPSHVRMRLVGEMINSAELVPPHAKTWLPIQGGALTMDIIQSMHAKAAQYLAMFAGLPPKHVRIRLVGEIINSAEMVSPHAKTWLPIQSGALTMDVIQSMHPCSAQTLAMFAARQVRSEPLMMFAVRRFVKITEHSWNAASVVLLVRPTCSMWMMVLVVALVRNLTASPGRCGQRPKKTGVVRTITLAVPVSS